MKSFTEPSFDSRKTIYWGEQRERGILRRVCSAAKPLPDDAPQAVKELAAVIWTPEVIQAAKDRLAARPKEG
jgi:hypothetical protein